MNRKICTAALAVGLLGLAAHGQAAAKGLGLSPGSYKVLSSQDICLEPMVLGWGDWYGEDFAGWGGQYTVGPTGQTVIFGNSSGGSGNDSMVFKKGSVQWTEWTDDLSYTYFGVGSLKRTSIYCTPPPARSRSRQKNPAE